MSLQNATIVNSCKRWPFIIDPQSQGTTWLQGFYQEAQTKEEENMDKQNFDEGRMMEEVQTSYCVSPLTQKTGW
jgi:hypothetical protein